MITPESPLTARELARGPRPELEILFRRPQSEAGSVDDSRLRRGLGPDSGRQGIHVVIIYFTLYINTSLIDPDVLWQRSLFHADGGFILRTEFCPLLWAYSAKALFRRPWPESCQVSCPGLRRRIGWCLERDLEAATQPSLRECLFIVLFRFLLSCRMRMCSTPLYLELP